MSNFKLNWDATGEKFYETGVDHGVLYPQANDGSYPKGVAWNGLTGVTESPSGADKNDIYADNIKYLVLRSAEDFGATVTCYTYPDEWEECDGSRMPIAGVKIGQQPRKAFGMCYRTLKGNDIQGTEYGYKLHILYNCTAAPSEKAYQTINDSPEAITFSWEVTTNPIEIPGFKKSAAITIDSTKVDPIKLKALEDILYGTATTEPRCPLPAEVISIFAEATPGVTLSTHSETVDVGETVTLTATTVPADAVVVWTASDDDITVSDGVVTGVNAGTSIVTATITVDNVDYTDSCVIQVAQG